MRMRTRAPVIDIGDRKQLFIDERFMEESRGISLVLNRPEKRGIVLEPTEAEGRHECQVATVLEVDGHYLMYYMTFLGEAPPGLRKSAWHVTRLARSGDGTNWERVPVGLIDVGEGRDNNVVMATGLESIHTGSGYSSGTGLTFNNTWRASGNIYDGAIVRTCSQVPSFGTGNNCAQAQFLNTSGAVGSVDLHLAPGDTVDRGTGTTGPSDDIDRQFRTAPIDLGADQTLPIDPTDTVPPETPANLRFL